MCPLTLNRHLQSSEKLNGANKLGLLSHLSLNSHYNIHIKNNSLFSNLGKYLR